MLYRKIRKNSPFVFKTLKNNAGDVEKFIEQSIKEITDQLLNSKPKVPQVNNNAMSISKKIENFIEKLKDLKNMHSYFQSDVLDSHINIFKILNNTSDKDYLRLPEPELVEPDSALPPLEEEDNQDN